MTNKLIIRMTKFLFATFCIVILCTVTVILADPNQAYCVKKGYLFRTINNVNGTLTSICQFPDGSSCDAHEFFIGTCGPTSSVIYRNYLMQGPTYSSIKCSQYGGRIYYVHTIYGDVPLCVLPDGRTLDISGYSNGGGANYEYDAWAASAYSWLNAP